MAVLLCFYLNKYPGATNTHSTSWGKCVLPGLNVALLPFLAQVGTDLQNHLLINKGLEFGYTNLCMATNEKNLHLGSMGRIRERGKEERITWSSFYSTSVPLVADLPWSLVASPARAPGQRAESKRLQEGRDICNIKYNIFNNKYRICNSHVLSFFISTFSAPSTALPSGKTGVKNQHFKTAPRLLVEVPEILSDHVNQLCCKGTPPGHGIAILVETNLPTQGLPVGTGHKTGLVKN